MRRLRLSRIGAAAARALARNHGHRGFAHLKGLMAVRAAGSSLSSPAAWQALETVRCVQIQIGDRTKLCVTRGSRQAAEVWKILRLTELDPPEPVHSQKQPMW